MKVMAQSPLLPLTDSQDLALQFNAMGDIAHKPPRMYQLLLFPISVCVNEHILDRSSPIAKPRAMIPQGLLPGHALEDIPRDLGFDMEIRDEPAEYLVTSATQQFQFSTVCPQNASLGPHPKHSQGRGLEEI